jgi:enoyl-[acyl-carrier protein] reductase I
MPRLLEGKRIVIAGIGDDQGFGWACAKSCAEQGARVVAATWVPLWRSFSQAYRSGRFEDSQRLSDGSMLEFEAILPLDACFDRPEHVPESVRAHRRYQDVEGYTVSEWALRLGELGGPFSGLIHTMANAPEIRRPLLETSREGYLAALSASSYSWVSMVRYLAPLMDPQSAALTITYDASQRVVPGYGGGMSSAKAALESDTRTLAFEAGRAYGLRINAISAGPLASRAARAIGPIEQMIHRVQQQAPLQTRLEAADVGHAAVFLLSPWAQAITGSILYVDHGLHAMSPAGLAQYPADGPVSQQMEAGLAR